MFCSAKHEWFEPVERRNKKTTPMGGLLVLAPLDGLEPTTPWLTVTCSANWAKEAFRGDRTGYCPLVLSSIHKQENISVFLNGVGIDLFSRSVARQVFSALQSLTSVFGMGTGGPSALKTPTINVSIDLSSRSVARQVFSALQSLTSVFGMGTGGPSALKTLT